MPGTKAKIRLRRLGIILAILLVLAAAAVRLTPYDPADWHVDPISAGDPGMSGVRIVYRNGDDLADLEDIILSTPRTKRIAGSIRDGRVTYSTRSFWWGFVDFTTIAIDQDAIVVLARSRYVGSDYGVNRDRVSGWLDRVQAIQN